MSDEYVVVESRLRAGGGVNYVVEGPGGAIVVREDGAGNLSGRIRSGYARTDESEKAVVARALKAVRELRRVASSDQETTERIR
jgi:hypothetical protein